MVCKIRTVLAVAALAFTFGLQPQGVRAVLNEADGHPLYS